MRGGKKDTDFTFQFSVDEKVGEEALAGEGVVGGGGRALKGSLGFSLGKRKGWGCRYLKEFSSFRMKVQEDTKE